MLHLQQPLDVHIKQITLLTGDFHVWRNRLEGPGKGARAHAEHAGKWVGGVKATLFKHAEQWAHESRRHWEGNQQRFSAKCTGAWDLELWTTLGIANFRVRTERVGGKQRRAAEGWHRTRKEWVGGAHGKCASAAAKCGIWWFAEFGRRGPMGGGWRKKGRLTLWRTWEGGYLVKGVADNRGRWAGPIGSARCTGATDKRQDQKMRLS